MQTKSSKTAKLTARDFTYVIDRELGCQTYQNCAYVILVGARSYYAVNYQGRTIAYNLRTLLSAIEVCAKHDAARRAQEAQ
jgi:hypothetical protein